MEQLKQQLKQQIIDALNLEEMQPADIVDDAPLFGEGLGLDSIDSLELIMMLDKNYGIKFPDKAAAKQALTSITTLADYITSHR